MRGSALSALPQPLQGHHPNQPGLSIEPHPTVDVQARVLGSASTCLRGWRGTTERLDDRGRRNETTSSSLDAVTCGQSVRFTAVPEGMGLERRTAIAEHRCPIATPARSSSRVASPRQPVDGIGTKQGHKVELHDGLPALSAAHPAA